jgi:hypothetical protein
MLRRLSGGVRVFEAGAGPLADVIAELDRRFPGMSEALLEEGRFRPGVVASIGGETTSSLFDVVPGPAELHFVLAISGG